jgi:hypothetical protein
MQSRLQVGIFKVRKYDRRVGLIGHILTYSILAHGSTNPTTNNGYSMHLLLET